MPASSPDATANSAAASNAVKSTSTRQTSYYDLLGVKPNASGQEIRRAYRDLSKLYHPDTTALESAIATVKFQALNEAYATLSSPEKRLTYDTKIGYSRLSVIQPLGKKETKSYDPTASAYISPIDRPLSAGELFALFILGVTFVGCLILVFALSATRHELSGEIDLNNLNLDIFPAPSAAQIEPSQTKPSESSDLSIQQPNLVVPSDPPPHIPNSHRLVRPAPILFTT